MNYAHRDCAGCTDLDCVHQPSPCFIESKPSPTCQTFGIELEFVVVARTDSLTRSVPEFAADWAPTFLTHQAFLAHGIPTFCPGLVCECKKFNPGKERIGDCVKGKVPAMSENSAGGKFGRWSVHIDQSAKLTDEEREFAPEGEYCIYSLELASRCFGAATDTNWQGEVAHVLAVMTSCLRGHGCAVLANDKCGLHVHMGYGDEKVPLGTCKSVLQLMTALERCFDQAHSTPRLAPGPNFTPGGQGHFNANLGYLHRAREAQENGREYDIFSTLANIQAAHGYESMGELFVVEREKEDHVYIQSGHSCTVNFDNTWVERCIRDDGGREISIDPIGTIEFRQHQSTLDVDVIAAWVIGCSDQVMQHYRALTTTGPPQVPLDPTTTCPDVSAFNTLRNLDVCKPLAVRARIEQKIADGDYGKQLAVGYADVEAVLKIYDAKNRLNNLRSRKTLPAKLVALQDLARRANERE